MLADPMKSEQASVNPHFLMIKIIRSTQFYRYVHRIYTRKCPFHILFSSLLDSFKGSIAILKNT